MFLNAERDAHVTHERYARLLCVFIRILFIIAWMSCAERLRAPAASASYSLKGQVILITGAAVGLGAAVAQHCKDQGAVGLLLVDRNEAAGKACAEKLNGACEDGSTEDCQHFNAVFVSADLGKTEDCQRVIDLLESTFATCHGVVNCAGITSRGSLEDTSCETWDEVMVCAMLM